MKITKFILGFLILLFTQLQCWSQVNNDPSMEMADLLHQNGKIYLVVFVLVTIFAGIIFLLVRIERKLNKLEKQQEQFSKR
jgi:uncharacterized membrane protein